MSQQLKVIEPLWEMFRKNIPTGMSEGTKLAVKQTFYAGAAGMASFAAEMLREKGPRSSDIRILDAAFDEAQAFEKSLRKNGR